MAATIYEIRGCRIAGRPNLNLVVAEKLLVRHMRKRLQNLRC